MAHTICIVHLDTGLVDERSSDTLSADMPVGIADEAMRASIDRSGHLHYRGADGRPRVCGAMTRRLADRERPDVFLVAAPTEEGSRRRWVTLNACVLEPAGDVHPGSAADSAPPGGQSPIPRRPMKAPLSGGDAEVQISSAELDRLECELRPLAASESSSDEVKNAVRRFNVRIEQERAQLEAARARPCPSGSFPLEFVVALKAAAVMFRVERDRIVRRFCFVPLPWRGS